ncbi:MAG: biopolymer transporter ExbD [Odoribacteraceae bacterium]|jgi:biopolymer transport protein ExbD|nr:biopolymer transporter ExbD [Odoribacteraceae bacterium]
MALKRARKINPRFSMASMTDIVFLLLLFFMISSTLINPNALRLLLPESTNQVPDRPHVTVAIDRNLVFYLNEKVTPFSLLEERLNEVLKGTRDPRISVQADKSVPVEQVVKVMNIAKRNDYRVTLATAPE